MSEQTPMDPTLYTLLYGVEGEEWPRWLGHLPWDVRAYYRRVVEEAREAVAVTGGGISMAARDIEHWEIRRCPVCGRQQPYSTCQYEPCIDQPRGATTELISVVREDDLYRQVVARANQRGMDATVTSKRAALRQAVWEARAHMTRRELEGLVQDVLGEYEVDRP